MARTLCGRWINQDYSQLSHIFQITKTQTFQAKYYLTACLITRIYKDDKSRWTLRELKQWIHYVMWSGVQHIYLCDHNQMDSERLDKPLAKYIKYKLVTYYNTFNRVRPVVKAHVDCWNHVINKHGRDSVWQLGFDMDEYPFVHDDVNEGFLKRYLLKVCWQSNVT